MKNTKPRFLPLAMTLLTISWTGFAAAESCPQLTHREDLTTKGHTNRCHTSTEKYVMVDKTFAANCLTLEDDYPECIRLRDEWRTKYDAAEAQVEGLLTDRDTLGKALEAETVQRLTLVASLEQWQREADSRFTTWEVVGIAAVAVVGGAVAGVGVCLVWCP